MSAKLLEQLTKEHRELVQQIIHLHVKEESLVTKIRRVKKEIRREQTNEKGNRP
jgi:translation initiation factor 2B subunit (eIF-2B alpha/beta/delta family)